MCDDDRYRRANGWRCCAERRSARRAGLPTGRRALSRRAVRARKRWPRPAASRRRRSAGSPRKSPKSPSTRKLSCRSSGPIGPGAVMPTMRRPPGVVSCDARHFRPFEWLPHLPCAALLQILLGTIDVPGGWRYKSPHPKPTPPGPRPAGKPDQVVPGKTAAGNSARLSDVSGGPDHRCGRSARSHR